MKTSPVFPWKRRIGIALVALGLMTIVGAVLYVLEDANGPGTGPKTFAERRSYDMVKESMHATFPTAFAVGVAGLALAMVGARLHRSAQRPVDETAECPGPSAE